MNISTPFIRRPVATTLLTIAIALGGALAAFRLPAAPMPEFDRPVVYVTAQMPGASPKVMATAVATPLERRLGAIADVSEIRSRSGMGTTVVSLMFGLDHDTNSAAREVQGAVSAARADLPAALRANPKVYKSSSASWPITYVSLTSKTMSVEQIYDVALRILQPQIASVQGVGETFVLGSSPVAVRVELNPDAVARYGVGFETVRAAIAAANANSPKGVIESDERRLQIYANDDTQIAADMRGLVVAYRNGGPIRLSDIAEVTDSVEDLRLFAITGHEPSVLVRVYRASGANVIQTVERIEKRLNENRAVLPPGIDVELVSDRTATIRASLRDLKHSLVLGLVLVVLVVFVFLRSVRATIIPAASAAVSLLGTAGVMHFLHYSLDNVSLMALIVAVGLVVDDSVIVIENIARRMESGEQRRTAALRGVGEVGFTVVAISASLITIFIPFLFIGDLVGRAIGEFVVTLCAAIAISLVVSLATTPMLCALLLQPTQLSSRNRLDFVLDAGFRGVMRGYERSLAWVLDHSLWALGIFFLVLCLDVYLYVSIPKGLLPQQDPGRLYGVLRADESISAAAMHEKLKRAADLILADPSVKSFAAVIEEGANRNSAELYVELKQRPERKESCFEINARLARSVSRIAGLTLRLTAPQDLSGFSALSGKEGQYQYELRGDDLTELWTWADRLTEALSRTPEVADVDIASRPRALETNIFIDRERTQRLGLSASQIDNALYDAFGQRPVSTIYLPLTQRRIVMTVAPRYRDSPKVLGDVYIGRVGGPVSGAQLTNAPAGAVTATMNSLELDVAADAARNQRLNAIANRSGGATSTSPALSMTTDAMIPLSAFARFETRTTLAAVSHLGAFGAVSISFNLPPDVALGDAMAAIERVKAQIHMPASIHSGFSGEALALQKLVFKEIIVIFLALAATYIILGMLYESFIHPITILSTLPPAGVGALLALTVGRMEFTIIAFVGVILLTGIVAKNAIMMIDVAIAAERDEGLAPQEAIRRAGLMRFRPIMMTTAAAVFGAVPLAIGAADGAELRQPLGVAIIGGLLVSQALTLYTTPVVYLYFDSLRRRGIIWMRALYPF
ncbi:MAG: efflux RND transporter permease subunit [Methylocystis sp.]